MKKWAINDNYNYNEIMANYASPLAKHEGMVSFGHAHIILTSQLHTVFRRII